MNDNINNYNFLNQLFSTQFVNQAMYMAQTFNPNNVPNKKLKALNDCAEAAEKLYNASKELDSEYWVTLGTGVALERFLQCQIQDQNQQGGIR